MNGRSSVNLITLTLIRGTVKLNGSTVLLVNRSARANSTAPTSHWFFGKKLSPCVSVPHRWCDSAHTNGASSVISNA